MEKTNLKSLRFYEVYDIIKTKKEKVTKWHEIFIF